LLFWDAKGQFRSKKLLCCSHLSRNSLPELTGKIF
jgi:hypothetical protein